MGVKNEKGYLDMVFWIPVAVGTVVVIFWALLPLLRKEKTAPAARASYDMKVFKDQLAEIDSDQSRGVISEAEAKRVRTEVSRRLLAAAKAEESEAPAPNAPKGATYTLAAVIALSISLGGLALYRTYGQPGLPDLPLSKNIARQASTGNERPSQAEAEAFVSARDTETDGLVDLDTITQGRNAELINQLIEILKERPDDLEGHRMLTRALASSGRMIEARESEEKVLALLGDAATAEDHLEHAELMILAAKGYVSPETIAALDKVMAAIPENPRARYYAGLALAQYGQPREAYIIWEQLLREGPEDAPWVPAIRAGIEALAAEAGIAPQAPLAGPTADQVDAAGDMTDAERSEMITNMVAQLTGRLAAEGGTVEEWVRLIGANVVLGETAAAQKAFEDANIAFAGDAAALAQIAAAGAQIP